MDNGGIIDDNAPLIHEVTPLAFKLVFTQGGQCGQQGWPLQRRSYWEHKSLLCQRNESSLLWRLLGEQEEICCLGPIGLEYQGTAMKFIPEFADYATPIRQSSYFLRIVRHCLYPGDRRCCGRRGPTIACSLSASIFRFEKSGLEYMAAIVTKSVSDKRHVDTCSWAGSPGFCLDRIWPLSCLCLRRVASSSSMALRLAPDMLAARASYSSLRAGLKPLYTSPRLAIMVCPTSPRLSKGTAVARAACKIA